MPPIWASKQDYVTLLWQIVSRGWALPCIPGLAAAALPRNIYVMLASAVNRISYYCNQEKIYIILPKLLMLFLCTYILHFNSIMNVKFTLEFIYLMLHLSTVVKWRTYLERKGYSTFNTVYESYLKVICKVIQNIFTRLYHCVVVWRKILDPQSFLHSWFIFCRPDKTKESTLHKDNINQLFSCVATGKCNDEVYGETGAVFSWHPGWHVTSDMTSD